MKDKIFRLGKVGVPDHGVFSIVKSLSGSIAHVLNSHVVRRKWLVDVPGQVSHLITNTFKPHHAVKTDGLSKINLGRNTTLTIVSDMQINEKRVPGARGLLTRPERY